MSWYSLETPVVLIRNTSRVPATYVFVRGEKEKYQYFWIEKSMLSRAVFAIVHRLGWYNVVSKNVQSIRYPGKKFSYWRHKNTHSGYSLRATHWGFSG